MLIGIDVGTTAVKAALFDDSGRTLKAYGDSYPTSPAAVRTCRASRQMTG